MLVYWNKPKVGIKILTGDFAEKFGGPKVDSPY